MKNLNLLLMLIITSCTMSQEQEINLDGEIATERTNSYATAPNLYFPFNEKKVFFKHDKEIQYSGFHWANTDDTFIGIAYSKNKIGRTTKGSIVRFDLNAMIIDTVYAAKENELAGDAYPSWNDNRLLFTMEIDHFDPENPLDQFNTPTSIVVMDLRKKEVIRKINNVGSSLKIEINESPWFKDEARFIYDIRGDRKIIIEGENIIKVENMAGIYLYDINTSSHSLLIEDGQYGVVSPVGDQVAYIKDKQIWIYDLIKKTNRTVYTAGEKEKVMHIHWTPNGQHIYLTNYNEFALGRFDNSEKLISVENGKEVPFKKLKHGFGPYTWK